MSKLFNVLHQDLHNVLQKPMASIYSMNNLVSVAPYLNSSIHVFFIELDHQSGRQENFVNSNALAADFHVRCDGPPVPALTPWSYRRLFRLFPFDAQLSPFMLCSLLNFGPSVLRFPFSIERYPFFAPCDSTNSSYGSSSSIYQHF